MRVRRYDGTLSFDNPWQRDDNTRHRGIKVVVRDTDDGNREAAFDLVDDRYVYNVFASREGGAWSVRYKCSYRHMNDHIVLDSAANSGMHIEGFQVDPRGDAATMTGVWIEDGIRYAMTYDGRLQSDQVVEDD